MYTSGHPALLYILIFYSIYFLIKSKTRNEFVIVFTIFLFLVERNSWENGIVSLTTSPIRTQPTDIALIVLLFFSILSILKSKNKSFRHNPIYVVFSIFSILHLFSGIFLFGYSAIAEYRTVFYFLIVMLFMLTNINHSESLYLIKQISVYLIPLILLIPINLILESNFSINVVNRQLGAFTYETITLGFIAGLLFYRFVDKKYKLPIYLLPVFVLTIPYASHRTVWAGIAMILPFLMYWFGVKKNIIGIVIFVLVPLSFLNIDASFLNERLTAFFAFQDDGTGSWRLLVWKAVIEDATLLGKGIGARFIVYAKTIGFDAMFGAHNGFIMMLYYVGYLGLLLLVLLFGSFYFRLFNISFRKNSHSATILGRVSFLATIMLTAYMIGYGFDLVGIIFITFSLISYKNTKYEKIELSKDFNNNSVF